MLALGSGTLWLYSGKTDRYSLLETKTKLAEGKCEYDYSGSRLKKHSIAHNICGLLCNPKVSYYYAEVAPPPRVGRIRTACSDTVRCVPWIMSLP